MATTTLHSTDRIHQHLALWRLPINGLATGLHMLVVLFCLAWLPVVGAFEAVTVWAFSGPVALETSFLLPSLSVAAAVPTVTWLVLLNEKTRWLAAPLEVVNVLLAGFWLGLVSGVV